jgi:hypothetical protein
MLDADGIAEIIATYRKHTWILRRVLLTRELNDKLGPAKSTLFGDVEIFDSPMDAVWFSRPPESGPVAWEIRYVGDIPFALLEKMDENDPEFDRILHSVEVRLHESISAKKSA